MGEPTDAVAVWIRPEDVEHPKLERLRRAIAVSVGPETDVSIPWLVWGTGLSRSWLFAKLEAGALVLIMPPWPEEGCAGLPAIRTTVAPSSNLTLASGSYRVGALFAMEPTPAWQEHGLFVDTKLAWLVAHEPFVGAGKAWLCTAELLVASPTTRPREACRLTTDLVNYIARMCQQKRPVQARAAAESERFSGGFTRDDAPYLLAVLGLTGVVDVEKTAQFMYRRLGAEPDPEKIARVLTHPDVQASFAQPVGERFQLAKIIDQLGFRSYRLEIEETAI